MLRLPAQLEIGPYTIHLDVLAARLQHQRRRIRRALVGGISLLALGAVAWLLGPLLRGTGVLVVPAYSPVVQLTLDGQPLAAGVQAAPSGDHTLRAVQAGTFPASVIIQVTRDQTTTLELPMLRPIPVVQPLPLPHQQSTWTQVSPDAGSGWRLIARRPAPEVSGPRPGWGQTLPADVPYLLHLDAQGLTRLSVLETYPVADEIITPDGARFWAVWEAQTATRTPGVAGTLTLTTPAGTQVLSTTTALRGLWWAPGGHALLVALPHDQGLDLVIVDPQRPRLESLSPLITVPGTVQSIAWHPTGRAAVVITTLEGSPRLQPTAPSGARPTPTPSAADTAALARTAVLIQLPPDGAAPQAMRLRVPPIRPGGLLPLAWSDTALWWVTDTGLGLALDRITLADGKTTRVGRLPDDLAALTVLPDATIRLIRAWPDGTLPVQRWPEEETLFTLPGIPASGPVGGTWQGRELLLATSPTALWYVQVQPEALR